MNQLKIGTKIIGFKNPVYIIAEIGINHNGDLTIAKRLIDTAVIAGCDAVKFQKRTPDICVPEEQKHKMRETPWGYITYLEYRHRVEFEEEEYKEIDRYCNEKGIDWLVSCWDIPSVDFMTSYNPVAYKIPSACLTDDALLNHINKKGRPVILSTGMSTMEEIEHAVSLIDHNRLIITHTTSTYPCPARELNLLMIRTLAEKFQCPVGYSGHETGLQTTIAAVALGACLVERHITLDRAMWGSDQAASVEPGGLIRLVRDIRVIEQAMGDGVKRVWESEIPIREKLRCK
jgi:N-acetylneuraminate synthase